jgi:choline transport protein
MSLAHDSPKVDPTMEITNVMSTQVIDDVPQLEARQLKSRFNIWAAIGIQFSITATPLAVGVYITLVLGLGGSPFFFYGFLVAAAGQMIVCLCLAEIASVLPHASVWVSRI